MRRLYPVFPGRVCVNSQVPASDSDGGECRLNRQNTQEESAGHTDAADDEGLIAAAGSPSEHSEHGIPLIGAHPAQQFYPRDLAGMIHEIADKWSVRRWRSDE